MKKKVIAVDFDDVVGGFNRAYIQHSARYYGSAVTYDTARTFDMSELYGVSDDIIVERVRNFCHHHHDEILFVEGAFEGMQRLCPNFDLDIVTSRCESLRDISLSWQDGFVSTHFIEHHFTNGFGSLYTHRRSKLEVCREIGASVLIDDAPSNAREVALGGITVLMPKCPWNEEFRQSAEFEELDIIPATSWREIVFWIENNL